MLHRLIVYTIIWLEFLIFATAIIDKSKVEEDIKVQRVPINPEKMVEVYQHWTDQAFSGLFAAVASKRFSFLLQSTLHIVIPLTREVSMTD
jgi:hypothetical protein